MEQKEAVSAIGEDMFSIALDQPFRFPASFTFVLRAFTTLEGLGRTLDPDYKFAAVAQPYALQLLQLQVDSAPCQALSTVPMRQTSVPSRSELPTWGTCLLECIFCLIGPQGLGSVGQPGVCNGCRGSGSEPDVPAAVLRVALMQDAQAQQGFALEQVSRAASKVGEATMAMPGVRAFPPVRNKICWLI